MFLFKTGIAAVAVNIFSVFKGKGHISELIFMCLSNYQINYSIFTSKSLGSGRPPFSRFFKIAIIPDAF
jgi:hypothetical protein